MGEDCSLLRITGKAAGTLPMRDYRAVIPYVSIEPAPARRFEQRRDHASSSSHEQALSREGTQPTYGSDGVVRLRLAHQGRCQLFPPPDPWRPGYWTVHDGAAPTLTATRYTVMLHPAGVQQLHAARHHSASARDKRRVGGNTCDMSRRNSNPSPGRSTGRYPEQGYSGIIQVLCYYD